MAGEHLPETPALEIYKGGLNVQGTWLRWRFSPHAAKPVPGDHEVASMPTQGRPIRCTNPHRAESRGWLTRGRRVDCCAHRRQPRGDEMIAVKMKEPRPVGTRAVLVNQRHTS